MTIDPTTTDQPVIEEKCIHEFDPDEGWLCIHCDHDGTEEVFNAIFDRGKDAAKYGP